MTTYDPDLHRDIVGANGESNRKFWPVNKFVILAAEAGLISLVKQDTEPGDTTKVWLDVDEPESSNGTVKVYSSGSWVAMTPALFAEHIGAGGGGGGTWGNISGTLSNQTDLQTALDAKQAADADLTSWAAVTRASGFDTFAATPSSANLRALLTDETGSGGAAVFATGPTISDPDFTGLTDIQQGFAFTGDISPSQITADQNDYAPTGFSTASVLRLSSDASRNITGLAGGSDGLVKLIWNVGAQNIVLKDESASSTAANRFALSADVTIAADSGVLIQYDATSSRWRLLGGSGGSSTSFDDNTGITDDSGNELLWFQKTASAVNFFEVTNSATGSPVVVAASGDDTNISLRYNAKGTGSHLFYNGDVGLMFTIESAGVTFLQDVSFNGADIRLLGGSSIIDTNSNEQIAFTATASAVNQFRVTNAATGTNPTLSVEGDDTNVAMTLAGKGTGLLFGTTLSQTGVLNNELFACISADYTLTSSAVAQRAFDIATNGAVAVAASTLYQFMAQFWVTSMSGSSGNAGFDLVGSGTATLTSVMYAIYGGDGSADVGPLAASVSVSEASASLVPSLTAATGNRMIMTVIGAFRTNAAGTIIPSIDLQTASAADVNANSFFRMWPVGTSSTESQGTWT